LINDPEVLAAALLHDTVEDTNTSPEEIESVFGKRVRLLVDEVTDNRSLPQKDRKKMQVEHARILSPEAALIKLGDKIANVRDVTNSPPVRWSIDRRREYLDWCAKVINNLPRVNPKLEQQFAETLEKGYKTLSG